MTTTSGDPTAADVERFERFVADPRRRRARYQPMVLDYYAMVTDLYLAGWGASHHFALFEPEQTLPEAVRDTQRGLADRAGLRPGMPVLDVGCGVGGPTLAIAEYTGAQVTGVDLTPDRVRIARRRSAEGGLRDLTRFVASDALALPFPDSVFGAVYSIESLCHVPDKPAAYREIVRVLEPGGVFVGHDWLRAENLSDETAERLIEPICRWHAMPALSTLDQVRTGLDQAGFAIEEVCDTADHGDLTPNWTLIEEAVTAVAGSDSALIRLMARGGRALCAAARSGAFLIGRWHARKPAG